MISDEIQKKYIEDGGGHCPFCDSAEIEGGRADFEGLECWSRVTCRKCGKQWHDIYTLTCIEEIHET